MEDCLEKVPLFLEKTSGDIPRLLPLMDGTEPRGPGGLRLRRRYYIAVATKQASPDYRSEVWPPIVKR